jgi:hypothetical protein
MPDRERWSDENTRVVKGVILPLLWFGLLAVIRQPIWKQNLLRPGTITRGIDLTLISREKPD